VKCIVVPRNIFLKDRFKLGQMVAVYGKLEPSRSAMAAAAAGTLGAASGRFKMIQPQFEIIPDGADPEDSLEMGRIVPSTSRSADPIAGQEAHLQVDAPRRLERLRAAKQRVR